MSYLLTKPLLLALLEAGSVSLDEPPLKPRPLREDLIKELRRLEEAGLVVVEGGVARPLSRALVAAEALKSGASLLELAPRLSWRDFESLCSSAFEANGFKVATSLRFKSSGRLYEVDVVAQRGQVLVAVDCKNWGVRAGKPPQLRRAVDRHLERARALADALPTLRERLGLPLEPRVRVVPCLVTLLEEAVAIHCGVPIVPVLKLNSFIQELHAYLGSLAVFEACP
ncbi:MAG: restriction endonuclease [Candidatus Nezhaarchaeota archaeon]|nr:restriction endonuclease [Candidatus Nezhaarchaeota archaeon]